MRKAKKLELLAAKVLRFLGVRKAEVNVFLVDDKLMRRLNREFLGKNSSTNVLSFPEPNFPRVGQSKCLGEIYLNPSYIKRHKENSSFMLMHGLLHLLGYNHASKGDRIKMEKVEKKLLSWLERQS